MSNVTIYFGAPSGAEQAVASEVKERGLNLLRQKPCQFAWHGAPTVFQPNFSIYKSHLALFLTSAIKGTPVTYRSSPYQALPNFPDRLPVLSPNICISFGTPINDEFAEFLRRDVGFHDTVIRGKPAMVASSVSIETISRLKEKKVLMTTPSIDDTVNLEAYRYHLFLVKLLTGFVKLHQYPAFKDKDHVREFEKLIQVSLEDATADGSMEVDEGATSGPPPDISPAMKFRVKLPESFASAPCEWTPTTVPSQNGLMLAYISDLARYDEVTVPNVVKTYFYHTLGDDEDDADTMYSGIKGAWGNLYKTRAGNVLSHLFKCVEICLTLQTVIKPIFSNGNYLGCVMHGAGYTLHCLGNEYTAGDAKDLRAALREADPHAKALEEIYNKFSFMRDEDRIARMEGCTRMAKLKQDIDVLPMVGGLITQSFIKDRARLLNFQGDTELVASAENISMVLELLSDSSKDLSTLPYMHHSMLFESSPRKIAWSVFGELAPSFRVPGGRGMRLDQPFTVKVPGHGPSGTATTREVKSIAAGIVPLELAIRHLDEVFEKKEILNPFGNSKVQVADSHLNKVFQGESATKILLALRKVTNSTVVSSGGKDKRARDLDGEEGMRKRRAVLDF